MKLFKDAAIPPFVVMLLQLALEVGQSRAQARLFQLFSRAWALAQLNPDFSSEMFNPAKALDRTIKPEPDPSP
jgi:hypothetical protein